MALCDGCFEDFVHPLSHELKEKNELFFQRYGRHKRWDWDDEAVTLTFSDPVLPTVRIDVSVVGTVERVLHGNGTGRTKISLTARSGHGEGSGFRRSQKLEKLTCLFLDADEYTGWEMTAVASHVLDAPGAYSFPTDRGRCFLLYRRIAAGSQTRLR